MGSEESGKSRGSRLISLPTPFFSLLSPLPFTTVQNRVTMPYVWEHHIFLFQPVQPCVLFYFSVLIIFVALFLFSTTQASHHQDDTRHLGFISAPPSSLPLLLSVSRAAVKVGCFRERGLWVDRWEMMGSGVNAREVTFAFAVFARVSLFFSPPFFFDFVRFQLFRWVRGAW